MRIRRKGFGLIVSFILFASMFLSVLIIPLPIAKASPDYSWATFTVAASGDDVETLAYTGWSNYTTDGDNLWVHSNEYTTTAWLRFEGLGAITNAGGVIDQIILSMYSGVAVGADYEEPPSGGGYVTVAAPMYAWDWELTEENIAAADMNPIASFDGDYLSPSGSWFNWTISTGDPRDWYAWTSDFNDVFICYVGGYMQYSPDYTYYRSFTSFDEGHPAKIYVKYHTGTGYQNVLDEFDVDSASYVQDWNNYNFWSINLGEGLIGWDYQKVLVINGSSEGNVTDYQIPVSVHYGGVDHFADNGVDDPLYTANYPRAVYHNNRTYVVWQGDAGYDPYITYYDHENNTWIDPVKVGTNPLSGDYHGAPIILIDNSSYIHVFFGSHSSNIEYVKSDNPENITAWTVQDDIVSEATYPNVIPDNGSIHLTYRSRTGDDIPEVYRLSEDNGASWSAETTIIEVDTVGVNGIYAYSPQLNGTNLHIIWRYYSSGDGHRNLYHAYLNLTDSHMYNVSGSDLGASISKAEADASCMVVDSESYIMSHMALRLNGTGYPYIIYAIETASAWDYRFTRWNGLSWVASETIAETDDNRNALDFILHSSTSITAFLLGSGSAGRGGDLDKWNWNGTTWNKVKTILSEANADKPLASPKCIVDYDEEIKVIFAQYGGVGVYNLNLYASDGDGLLSYPVPDNEENIYTNEKCKTNFGDIRFTDEDGTTELDYFLQEKTNSDYAMFWVKVPFIPSSPDNTTIYIYYGNSDATTTSNGTATFPWLFDDFAYYSINDTPNVIDWSTEGTGVGNTIDVQADPGNASQKAFRIVEAGEGTTTALKALLKGYRTGFAFHFRTRGNTDDRWDYRGYEDAVYRTAIERRHDVGRLRYHNGAAYADFTPAAPGAINTWYEIVDKTMDLGESYLAWEIDGTNHVGGWQSTAVSGINAYWFFLYRLTAHEIYLGGIGTSDRYIFVRKFVTPEPAHADWEAEEETGIDAVYVVTDPEGDVITDDPLDTIEEAEEAAEAWDALYGPVLAISIANIDAVEWVFEGKKRYEFTIIYINVNLTDIQQVGVGFTDEINHFHSVWYDRDANTLTVTSPEDSISGWLSSISQTDINVTAVFHIMFNVPIPDSYDVSAYARIVDTADRGWITPRWGEDGLSGELYLFNIYNLGGLSTLTKSGTAGRVTGGDIFEIYAADTRTRNIVPVQDFDVRAVPLPEGWQVLGIQLQAAGDEQTLLEEVQGWKWWLSTRTENQTIHPTNRKPGGAATNDLTYVSWPFGLKIKANPTTSNGMMGEKQFWRKIEASNNEIVTVQVHAMTPQTTGTTGKILITDDGYVNDLNARVALDSLQVVDLVFAGNGSMRLTDGVAGYIYPATYTGMTWYNFTFIINCTAQNYDMYVDEVLNATDVDFRQKVSGADSVGHITFMDISMAGNFTEFYVDDLWVYTDFDADYGGYAEATMLFKHLQHWSMDFDFFVENGQVYAQGASHTPQRVWDDYQNYGYVELGWDVMLNETYVNDFLVARVNITDGYISGKNDWIKFNVTWYKQGVYIKNDLLYGLFEGYSIYPGGEKDTVGFHWDIWFNRANASTVIGARINTEFYGMSDKSVWWAVWSSKWKPMRTEVSESTIFIDLEDANATIHSAKDVLFVRSRVKVLRNTLAQFSYKVLNIAGLDFLVARDTMSGIDTPPIRDTVVPDILSGFFGSALGGIFSAALKRLGNTLAGFGMGFFTLSIEFIDNVFAALGYPALVSTIFGWMDSLFASVPTLVGYGITMIGNIFTLINVSASNTLNQLTSIITIWAGMYSTTMNMLNGVMTPGINLWNDLGINSFIQIGAILYPLWLLIMGMDKGMQAVIDHLNGVLNIGSFFLNFILNVGGFFMGLLTGLIGAIRG